MKSDDFRIKAVAVGAFASFIVSFLSTTLHVHQQKSRYEAQRSELQAAAVAAARGVAELSTQLRDRPSLDEQILDTRKDLQTASNIIRNLRFQISSHAQSASSQLQQSRARIAEAQELLQDIVENSEQIVAENERMQARILELAELYQRKIEDVYQMQMAQEPPGFGIELWVAVIGFLATASGIVLAWRKDRREIVELRHKLETERLDRQMRMNGTTG